MRRNIWEKEKANNPFLQMRCEYCMEEAVWIVDVEYVGEVNRFLVGIFLCGDQICTCKFMDDPNLR